MSSPISCSFCKESISPKSTHQIIYMLKDIDGEVACKQCMEMQDELLKVVQKMA